MARFHTCPRCRALLDRKARRCPYCDADQRPATAPTESEEVSATTNLGSWILLFNVAIFALSVLVDPAPIDRDGLRLEPSLVSATVYGACEFRQVKHCGQYWRFVSANFIHFDLLHLLMNSVAIFLLVPLAAVTLGAARTTAIYFVSGATGSSWSYFFAVDGYVAGGASGAVCGLIGALAVWGWRQRTASGRALHQQMIIWAAVILVFGLVVEHVDNAGHIGGFAAGAVLGWFAGALAARGGAADRAWRVAAISCVVTVVALAALFVIPSIARGLDRREVIVYDVAVRRALDALEEPGSAAARDPGEGPTGAEAVEAAMETAFREKSAASIFAARQARAKWMLSLRCSHAYWEDR